MGKIVCIGGLNGLKNEKGDFIAYEPRKVDKEIRSRHSSRKGISKRDYFSWNECRKLLLV